MKKPNNPFILSGYHSPLYFCDREDELRELRNHIENDRNVVLFSWRRLGKSALIKRYLVEEEKKKELVALYIDLMATNNSKKAVETLIEEVYSKFGKTRAGVSNAFQNLIGSLGLSVRFDPISGMPSFSLNVNRGSSPSDSLQSIGKFLESQKKQIVVAIDEFQQVSRYKDEDGEALFRSFMQKYPTIRFIFSGSHREMMVSMFMEQNRPFYRSCQLMALSAIPLVNYSRFIQYHFNKDRRNIAAETVAKVYQWCRGQTYAMQLIFNKLYGSNLPLDYTSVEEIQSGILEQESPVFTNYFHLLSAAQWNTIKAIAKAEAVKNPLSKDFLQEHDLGAASTVSSALKVLVDKELVAKEDGEYFVHDVIFSRWLERI